VKLATDPSLFALAGVQDLLFKLLSLAHIPHNAGKGALAPVSHFAYGQLDGKNGPVFLSAKRIAADADHAGDAGLPVALHISVVLAAVGLGHKDADVTANDLAGVISEHRLRRPVERLNDAAFVDHHDAFDGCVQNGAQVGVRLS